jgi:sulfofructose kinase
MRSRVVCVGNLVQDEVFTVAVIPSAGIKVGVLDYRERFGGPAATAAYAIGALGGTAAYWGRVGDDAAGDKALRLLADRGVDCAGVARIAGGRTNRAIVLVDQKGERGIVSDRLSLPADPGVLPPAFPLDTGVVLADSRWPAGAERALARAREAGIVTVLDADGGPREEIARLVALADHAVFSSEGLRDFVGDGPPEDLLRHLAVSPGQVVAVTCGAAGSCWLLSGEVVRVPAFAIDAVDTTGCGDVFHGAYALGLCEGRPPFAAAGFATAAAALKAANGRGWDGMPNREAVDRLLASRV